MRFGELVVLARTRSAKYSCSEDGGRRGKSGLDPMAYAQYCLPPRYFRKGCARQLDEGFEGVLRPARQACYSVARVAGNGVHGGQRFSIRRSIGLQTHFRTDSRALFIIAYAIFGPFQSVPTHLHVKSETGLAC